MVRFATPFSPSTKNTNTAHMDNDRTRWRKLNGTTCQRKACAKSYCEERVSKFHGVRATDIAQPITCCVHDELPRSVAGTLLRHETNAPSRTLGNAPARRGLSKPHLCGNTVHHTQSASSCQQVQCSLNGLYEIGLLRVRSHRQTTHCPQTANPERYR